MKPTKRAKRAPVGNGAASPAPVKPEALKEKVYPLCDFLDDLRDVLRLKTHRRYCFVLGSGASLPSGIMSGRELATNWLKEMYIRCHPGTKEIEATEAVVSPWATEKQLGIAGFSYDDRASFYGDIYVRRFRTDPKLGQEYLRHVIDGKTPSFGYSVLARILARTDHRIVITTNFDHLTEEALQRYAGVEPHVVGDEELAKYLGGHHDRPVIAKIHGDIFRKTYNAAIDIQKLRKEWETPLRAVLKNYIPIFIGYGGNDPGFMQFLAGDHGDDWLPHGFIWTYRPTSGLPQNFRVTKLIGDRDGRFVPIAGFDEFLLLLGDVFEIGKLDKEMEAENAKRVELYRKSFDEVIVTLRDHQEFTDAAHYPDLVRAVITRLAGEKAARGWWDWQVEAKKETFPAKARLIYEEGLHALPKSPQLLATYTGFLAQNFPGDRQAEAIGKRAVEEAEKSLGPEHSITLQSRNNLALLYNNQGQYDKALPLYEQTLITSERVLGPEHPNTLTSRNNLASLYESQGEYDKALPVYEQTLAARERVLGPEHPDTLNSRNNLALLCEKQGQYDKALRLYEQTLIASERVLGPEHSNTLKSRNNLALLYNNQGRYDKALPLYEQTLIASERVLGPEHPTTLTGRNNLANLYASQGKYDKALPLYEQTLAARERVLGPEHPNTLNSRNNLATLYCNQGQYEKGLPFLEQTVLACERALGFEHPDTKHVRSNLAECRERMAEIKNGKHN